MRRLESSPENIDSSFEISWQTKVVHLPDRSPDKPHMNLKPHVPDAIRLKNLPHMPIKCTSRRCALCSTRANPHRTTTMCGICSVALCMNKRNSNCFQLFHTK